MEKRNIDIKITSNAKKVMNDLGTGAEKAGKKSTGALSKIKGLFSGVTGAIGTATTGVRAFATALISSGVGAVVVALGGLIAGLRTVINRSSEFEQSLSTLKAITGATNEEIAALSQNAKELGRTTAFTASQVVELQTEFSKLGFTTGEILGATEATLNLAAAAGVDLAEAATVAGSTLRGFGLDTGETGRVVDVMAKSFTSSALDMEKFKESMKLVAPIAKTTKVSIEESAAALSVLADRGVAGSMAGTQLRRIMSDLATKTGKSFQDSLEITADRLQAATTTADKLAIAKELVGDRAKGSLIALAENRDQLLGLKDAYEQAGGAADAMANEKLDNLKGDLTKLGSAFEGFILGVEDGGGILNKISRGAIQLLTNSLTFLTKASEAVADGFAVNFASVKRVTSTAASRLGETFTNMGLMIRKFSAEALISLSEVPIIGKLIDKASAEESLVNVEAALVESNERLSQLAEKAGNESVFRAEHFAKLRASRELKVAKDTSKAKQVIEQSDEFVEGNTDTDSGAQKAIDKKLDFKRKLKKAEEDFDAQTALEKNELARDRHLAELEELELNETEKAEMVARIKALYADKAQMISAEAAIRDKEEGDRIMEEKMELEERLAQRKFDLANEAIDNASRIAGQETTIGKLLLAAKTALNIREQIMNAKKTISEAKESAKRVAMKAAEGSADVAAGSAKAASSLNPLIIASYAATAIGVIASIASAVKKSKSLTGQFGGGTEGGGVIAPTVIKNQDTSSKAPSFNVIGQTTAGEQMIANTVNKNRQAPIRAYVVSDEVTNEQQLDNRVKSNASL